MGGARRSRSKIPTLLFLCALLVAVGCAEFQPEVGEQLASCSDDDSNPGVAVSFKTDIRPLMNGAVPGTTGCRKCHYPEGSTREGLEATGLDLSRLGSLRKGGRNTQANIVVASEPCGSALVQKLRGTFGGARMPKGGPYWDDAQIRLVMDWIAEGANGSDDE